jgi:ABC-2 type transport system permease protein
VLLSSVRPFDLLLGKVVGVGAASLLQLGIWAGSAMLVASKFSAKSLGTSGVQAPASGGFTMPNISPELVLVTLVYFLIGFLLFAAVYAAVGAMCNSVQETQQFQMPVTVVAMLGYFGAFGAINNPGSQLARVLSFVPPTAPFVVPVRYAISPLPIGELALSMAVSVLGVLAVIWIAGRIYRVGILSYGKRPTPREVLRWIRAS